MALVSGQKNHGNKKSSLAKGLKNLRFRAEIFYLPFQKIETGKQRPETGSQYPGTKYSPNYVRI